MSTEPYTPIPRWYCPACGIVRDINTDAAPWCRHNAIDQPARRMKPISPSHPMASDPLPWGNADPAS